MQLWENCQGQDGGGGSPEEHMGVVSKLGECITAALTPQVSVRLGWRQGREMVLTSCFVLGEGFQRSLLLQHIRD